MKKQFKYKDKGINWNVDAQVAGEAIESIQKENGGKVTPKDVVTAAKKEGHALHGIFDWDIHSAAEKHWLQIARQLIGSITVTIQHHEGVRAHVSVKVNEPETETETRSYVGIGEALKPEYEEQIRESLLYKLKGISKHYTPYPYLAVEVQQINLLIEKMENDMLMFQEPGVEIPA